MNIRKKVYRVTFTAKQNGADNIVETHKVKAITPKEAVGLAVVLADITKNNKVIARVYESPITNSPGMINTIVEHRRLFGKQQFYFYVV